MVANFTPVPRPAYRIGVPEAGCHREMLNSDAALYGGSNMGNGGGVHTDPIADHGYEQSISRIVPPLGFVLLKRSTGSVFKRRPIGHVAAAGAFGGDVGVAVGALRAHRNACPMRTVPAAT
jgi:hypothetical protein